MTHQALWMVSPTLQRGSAAGHHTEQLRLAPLTQRTVSLKVGLTWQLFTTTDTHQTRSHHGNSEAHSQLSQQVGLGYPTVLKDQVGCGRGSDSQLVFFLSQ